MSAPATALQLIGVTKSFGDLSVIRGVNLSVGAGERHAIIGPNGAGKSTLFNLISGLFPLTEGDIRLRGRRIAGLPPHKINRSGLARSFQITNIFHRLSVFENVRIGVMARHGVRYGLFRPVASLRRVNDEARDILDLVRLGARADDMAGDLTYSEQRALEIGMTLTTGADVILLDEPTVGMSREETARGRTHPRSHQGQDAAGGRARHERRVQPMRPRLRAGVRGDPGDRYARKHPRQSGGSASLSGRGGGTVSLLEVRGLHAHYGKSHILHGVDLTIPDGAIVSLLGRNGSGRSTTLKAIMGLVAPSAGSVRLGGRDLAGRRPFQICRQGIGFVPEERLIFPNLTVEENLLIGMQKPGPGAPAWTLAQMYDYFPRLSERSVIRAGHLSGGEQQMLTICRSLLGNPRVLLIDEPTEGLAPKVVDVVTEVILDVARRGVAVVLVEQKLTIALKIAAEVMVMGHGKIVFRGTPNELANHPDIRRNWLEVA
jgi:branched-chain amino acid transport system ATP-binding protein